MKKVKIQLKCHYGLKVPGDIIEVDESKANIMISENSAFLSVDRLVGETKTEKALRSRVLALEKDVVDLEKKNTALEKDVVDARKK